MHDFIIYLLSLLRRGLLLAVPAVMIGAGILAVYWRSCRRKGRSFSWSKAVCWLLLLGWLVVLLFVTLLMRRESGASGGWNWHFLLAWREAWNSFSLKGWLYVLLNIALFVPLGVLLPLMFSSFRAWYRVLPVGFGGSLAVELLQLLTNRGMFDVDDLFTNTLGCMLGWALVMMLITVVVRQTGWGKRLLGYLALPAVFSLTIAAIFGIYALKPYGNLPENAVCTANLHHVRWQVDFTPEDVPDKAQVYAVGRMDKIAAEAFAAQFARQVGAEFDDAYYYDDLIIFANHSTGDFLNLNQMDGTWEYTLGQEQALDCGLDEVAKETLMPILDAWDLDIPADAVFSTEPGGEGFLHAVFEAADSVSGKNRVCGSLDCVLYDRDGKAVLYRVVNHMVPLTPHQEESILTPEQALKKLQAGRSFYGMLLSEERDIEVKTCALDWTVDTKGFYQPIYRFTLRLSDGTQMQDAVSALK